MTVLRWVFSLSILSIWAALIGTILYVLLYAPPETPGTAKAIVILGGGPARDNLPLRGQSAERLAAGLELYNGGAAKLIVVTGGGTPAVAEQMAKALAEKGLPRDAILVENRALSTLQNALFTADLARLDPADPILLVTHRYHMPRALASFQWAGFSDVTSHVADPDAEFRITRAMLWEGIKWPVNVLRAAGVSLAGAFGVPRTQTDLYLQ
ncbi:MAG: YdcF family protein [Silicimonas sp.]|nr:YdcF family protein [Silicimonas sp.]